MADLKDKQLYKDGLIVVNGYEFTPEELTNFGNTNTLVRAIEPSRGEDFSMADIEEIPMGEVPRLQFNFEVMTLKTWRKLKVAVKAKQFPVTYYDWEYDEVVTHLMYFATQDQIDIFMNFEINQEYYILSKKTVDIVATNNERQEKVTLNYNANGGTFITGETTSQKLDANEMVTLKDMFTLNPRENFVLTKWNTQADGSGYDFPLNMRLLLTRNINLYAIWQAV